MNLPNKVRLQMEKIAVLRREKQQLINNKEKELEKIKNRFEKKIEKLDEKILNEQIKLDELLEKFNNDEPKKPNAKIENNKTKEKEVTQVVKAKSFFIQPRKNLWIGYKNLDTGKSYQITTSEMLQLDASKTWLLTSGHGNIDITVDGVTTKYSESYTMRFFYKDGVIKKVNYKKYQELDAGSR